MDANVGIRADHVRHNRPATIIALRRASISPRIVPGARHVHFGALGFKERRDRLGHMQGHVPLQKSMPALRAGINHLAGIILDGMARIQDEHFAF